MIQCERVVFSAVWVDLLSPVKTKPALVDCECELRNERYKYANAKGWQWNVAIPVDVLCAILVRNYKQKSSRNGCMADIF